MEQAKENEVGKADGCSWVPCITNKFQKMFEGVLVRGRENYDCKEENNTFVQNIFFFSAEGKTPEFL